MRYLLGILIGFFVVTSTLADSAIYTNLDSGWGRQSGLPGASDVAANKMTHPIFPSVWSMDLGYNHDINYHLGVGAEAGAAYFGKAKYTFPRGGDSTVATTVISFMAEFLGHYRPADFVLKMGLARVNMDVMGIDKGSRSRPHFEIGVGSTYRLTPHFALQATYIHIFGSNLTSLANLTDTPRINAVLTGLRVTF